MSFKKISQVFGVLFLVPFLFGIKGCETNAKIAARLSKELEIQITVPPEVQSGEDYCVGEQMKSFGRDYAGLPKPEQENVRAEIKTHLTSLVFAPTVIQAERIQQKVSLTYQQHDNNHKGGDDGIQFRFYLNEETDGVFASKGEQQGSTLILTAMFASHLRSNWQHYEPKNSIVGPLQNLSALGFQQIQNYGQFNVRLELYKDYFVETHGGEDYGFRCGTLWTLGEIREKLSLNQDWSATQKRTFFDKN